MITTTISTSSLHQKIAFAVISFAWFAVLLAAIFGHTIYRGDEFRYLTAAFEMWQHHNYLVPTLNGHLYPDKTPLLYWLFLFGWWVTGLNTWWPQTVTALLSFACVALTYQIAKQLWPNKTDLPWLAALMLASMLYWALSMTIVRFDLLVTASALLSLWAVLASRQHVRQLWWRLGLALGLGLLAKGPAVLICALPAALFAPIWLQQQSWKHWYLQLCLAFALGCLIALCWAIPAAMKGGHAYAAAIFWHQSVDRLHGIFNLDKLIHFYYPKELLAMCLPWIIWPPVVAKVPYFIKEKYSDELKFLALSIWLPIIIFTFIPRHANRYLLPLLPLLAIVFAWCTQQRLDRNNTLLSYEKWIFTLLLLVLGMFVLCLPLFIKPGLYQQKVFSYFQHISSWWGLVILIMAAGWQLMKDINIKTAVLIIAIVSFILIISYSSLSHHKPQQPPRPNLLFSHKGG